MSQGALDPTAPDTQCNDPCHVRGIYLADAVHMVFQMVLLCSLSGYVSRHNLLTSAQGTCQAGDSPFNTVYTLLSYIQHSHEHGPALGGLQIPAGLVVALAPVTLEFWVRFPNERNQGKQGATLC